jgi:glycosyltransferase involved in cell wall biosynthesis
MGVMQKTAIIIPCYNEARRLQEEEFALATRENRELHLLFVDDGSNDGTPEKLKTLCRSNPSQMQLMALDTNSGKAEAVRRGVLRVLDSEYANVGYWDADLATPLGVIPKFCEILETRGLRLVMGARVRLLGRKIERRALRHYAGRIFATLSSILTGLPIYDTQCGAKVFRNCKELKILFGKPFRVNWTFDVEILARMLMIERYMGTTPMITSTIEYPLEEWTDVPGSKIGPGDFLVGFMELCSLSYFLHAPGAERRFAELKKECS